MIAYGDELVTIVQIDQPFCTREFGDHELNSPAVGCTAELGITGSRKCFNTRATCQDAENYNPGTLTLTFARSQEGLEYLGYVIPSLESVRITPLKINIGAMDRSLSPFGQREVVTMQFADHQHSDLTVDKYRLERHSGAADQDGAYDPYALGSFWGKWIARNPYNEGYALRVYQGSVGDALADMEVRHYLIDKINGPDDGAVTIVAKDLFTKVEGRKAKAPGASRGELAGTLTAAGGSSTLSPTGIGALDYPASGRVAIGKEILAFTRSGDAMTWTTRGDLNTVAEEHDAEDKVQLVLSYEGDAAQDIVYDLLTTYALIPAANITAADWDAEAAENFVNVYTGHIAEPTSVAQLVGELAEQVGFSIWPDVVNDKIRLKAIVPAGAGDITATVDDDNWIKDGTLDIRRMPDQRVSQVWVYYGQINPLDKLDENKNYRSRVISVDLNAEDSQQYGTASIREVFSRWIAQFGRGAATEVGERLLSIFRDPPFRASFELHAVREGALDLAEPFRLDTDEVVDDTGANKLTTHVPIKLSREEDAIMVEAQQLQFFIVAGGDSPGQLTERQLFIDSDTLDFNLRTAHDALFSAPGSGDVVRVFIATGVVVGSTGVSAAFQTGGWPAGVIIYIENLGTISGKGGAAGDGGEYVVGISPVNSGSAGSAGGLALAVTAPVNIYNILGVIQGGGGGGGGGGAGGSNVVNNDRASGSGGGGGAGSQAGVAGVAGAEPENGAPATNGGQGTVTAGGAGGPRTTLPSPSGYGGAGGAGGNPGLAGAASENGASDGTPLPGSGAAGGAAGAAISGIANINWIDANDVATGDDGTVTGATS